MRRRQPESAFTLVEMLTVIGIIVLLAGLLVPALMSARKRAQVVTARADIAHIEMGLKQYAVDFGVYPPDTGTWDGTTATPTRSYDPIGHADNQIDVPGEALVFFLGTGFSRSYSNGNTANSTNSANDLDWDDEDKRGTAYAKVTAGPYIEFKRKQLKNLDNSSGHPDSFDEFLDPWGHPYLYNGPGGYGATSGRPYHNRSSVDIYSVGPNGVTRQATKKYTLYDASGGVYDFDLNGVYDDVMGSKKDGNDVPEGNPGTGSYDDGDKKKADDVNNW